jgi:hypothetical protein
MKRRLAPICAAVLLWPMLAHAETDVIKIPRGAGGVGFLPLLVMEQKGLIERHAREAGIANLKVDWLKLGGPALVNACCCRARRTLLWRAPRPSSRCGTARAATPTSRAWRP